jgi:hypothetical protein
MKNADVGELLGDAVIHDGFPDHRRESYVREMGKSRKAAGLGFVKKGNC